ncbi:unnamed protein product [Arctia plantaginis]|uniref:Uncharacterized protein n=1 Tax=Arctia plantaginis TaxID=874455 RepID=A0A8S1B088_ARCPL|nr:unnamed protein product [Arctia plantaginis]
MMWQPSVLILTVLLTQAYAAPQFITFKEGKLGVNFGGYHAAVGLGGLLGGNGGAEGGLFAEAGTPHGQAARAGLGGSVGGNGGPSGGLYADATAGGNVKAAAGLGGEVNAERSSGGGFASASSGGHYASSALVGATGAGEIEVEAAPVVKSAHKKVYTEVNLDASNEIVPVAKGDLEANLAVKAESQPAVVVKEVYVEPPPPQVIEKTIIRAHKPHRHHFRKTAYIGGYIGANADAAVAQPTVVKTIQPIERRSDVGLEGEVYAGAGANGNVNAHHDTSGEVTYTKRVTVQKNPTFFQDIFNIPIATLKAVNSFLTNAAGSTSVSVQKSASVRAESDLESSKHVPASNSVASSSEAHVSVKTPSATKFIDDIFSIPINTLSAVNTFLENNAARKQVQINGEVSNQPTKIRLGPHARRRANKQVIIVQEPAKADPASETESQ